MDGARAPVEAEERAAQFRTRLAGRQVLIVLDDARDAAQVRPLLPGSASCSVLITARWAMPELVGSRLLDLDVLPPAEARALFGRVAGEERAVAEPGPTNEVLTACAGLPLAIRIARARLAARGGWNVRTLAGRLSNERRRLDELRAGNLAVRASFEVSFASLGGATGRGGVDPARTFRLLGLWTGPFIALPAAYALLGQEEQPVADALEVLVDEHLLESHEPESTASTTCCGATRPTAPTTRRPTGTDTMQSPGCSSGTCTPPRPRAGSSPRSTPGCRWIRLPG